MATFAAFRRGFGVVDDSGVILGGEKRAAVCSFASDIRHGSTFQSTGEKKNIKIVGGICTHVTDPSGCGVLLLDDDSFIIIPDYSGDIKSARSIKGNTSSIS